MSNRKKVKMHFVANNHIDREWTYDVQQTRMLTMKFFEDMIETFEKIPDFQFVLDSQTVPLEDFLEILPHRKNILKKYIAEKRLWVGPWYSAPDCFYLNGESVVRNLLVGHEVAESFGNVSKFGYTPFGWGQISQLPQIYAGFGICSIFFYRGADTIKSNYYRWKGADGTEADCIKYHRTNFWEKVFRPITKKRDAVPWDREFDYFGNEVPFMFCTDDHKYEHGYVVDGKYHINKEEISKVIGNFIEKAIDDFPGKLILAMNGMDTCFPPLKGLLAIDMFKNGEEHNYEMIYSSLDRFYGELKEAAALNGAELQIHSGEMRRFLHGFGGPGKAEAKSTHFYLASVRPRQKSRNTKAENILARYAEPFAVVSHILGKCYPTEYITAAWKYLLRCHSHDTIAGCGIDQIEKDMLNRLDQSINISRAVLNMSLQHIVLNIDNSQVKDNELALVVFNPSPFARREVVPVWLHIPEKLDLGNFEIVDVKNGKILDYNITERGEMTDRIFRDPTDTSLYTYGELVNIHLDVEVDGLGYKTLLVRKSDSLSSYASMLSENENQMENEYLKVTINKDGTFTIVEKTSGRKYDNLHYFTDTGDNGDAWVRFVPDDNRVFSSRAAGTTICLLENSSLRARYEIKYQMMIPKGLNKKNYIMEGYYDYTASSEELVPLKIRSITTLSKWAKYLDIETEIDNQSTDHLVQAVFPTGLIADRIFAESGFDVVARSITRNDKNIDPSLVNGEDPFLRFVDMSDGANGLAILSDSVKGYEVLGDRENSIALNLIRSHTSQIVTIYGRKERRPDQELSQAGGIHAFHYAIYPHSGTWKNGCLEQAEKVNYPLLPVQTHRSFGRLPSGLSFVRIAPSNLVLSALKKANKDRTIIIRVYNPTTETVEGEIAFFTEIACAEAVNLNEEPIDSGNPVNVDGNMIRVRIGAKKICTYKLYFGDTDKNKSKKGALNE